MMCETMANIPVENKTSYVLTEDMIDAAMNEQFSYQEDLESEEELSSQEDIGDQETPGSCVPETQSVDSNNDKQESSVAVNVSTINNSASTANPTVNGTNASLKTTPVINANPPCSPVSNNKVSVLVIETGLEKTSSDRKSPSETMPVKENQSTKRLNTSFDEVSKENNPASTTQSCGDSDSKENLNILKTILSSDKAKDGIIDLCESEVDNCSEEDEMNEAETIDDELRSVMETNLMAEIGISVNKKTQEESCNARQNVEKIPEKVGPRISVKDIAHISTHAFNSIPQNGCSTSIASLEGTQNKMIQTQCPRNLNFTVRNPNYNLNIPINANNQVPSSIHINKIAVPHTSFVNSQGQRMKCVYVKSSSNLPFVINTPTQTTTSVNSNRFYSPPVRKVQMPAITALKNLTKNIQPQTLLLQKNPKVLSVTQKLQKPQMMQNVPPKPQMTQNVPPLQPTTKREGSCVEFLKNSLLAGSSNKPYSPPDTFPEDPTYSCIDCNDKFLMKSSLVNHIERRSMNIRYWCRVCNCDLQFYNRCALSVHLRGHNNLKFIDFSCLTITPLPKEMLEKGIVSTFLRETDPSNAVASVCSKPPAVTSSASSTNSVDSGWKTVSTTTVAGQSKGVCYQSPDSSEIGKPVTSDVNPQYLNNRKLPLLLPKAPNQVKAVALVSTKPVPNAKELSVSANHAQPKSLIVFCNKLPPSSNMQSNSTAKPSSPNVVIEPDSRLSRSSTSIDDNNGEMIVLDDTSGVPKKAQEDVMVDVQNFEGHEKPPVTVPVPVSQLEKRVSDKETKNTPSTLPTVGSKRNCSECKAYCVNISKHLNGTGRPMRADLACKICNLILPSKCSLKIHHRIHMKISPFKCPDCGKDFTTWDELHAHLKFSCGHFAKCVRFICKGCKAHFPTQTGLAHHIVKNHGKDIFKCSLCPVAFYKKPSLVKHIANDHVLEKNKSKAGMDYKQCEMCPKKLLPEENFLAHAKEHTNSMIYGYKCSMCNIVYANKMAFIIHQIKEKTKKGGGERSVQSDMIHKDEPAEEMMQASDSNSDFEDEPVIIRKYPELDNESSMAEKDPLSLDDWETTQEQKVKEKTVELCIVCKKNSVVLLPGIDLNNQSLCCKQCVKPLDGDSSVGSSKTPPSHAKSNKNRQSKPKNIYRSSSTDEITNKVVKKRRISEISLSRTEDTQNDSLADSPTKKKSRKKQKEKSDSKGQTHIQGQVIKSRSQDELHKCSKCLFITEKRETFLQHITVHRTDPNTFQCLECGLCFVVMPSLERHLQMHHGIKDVNNYIECNKASLPRKATRAEEEIMLQNNQCRVCHVIFDSQSSLDKHFRIHGMAFMSQLSKSP